MIHRARVCRTNSRRATTLVKYPGRLPSSARRHMQMGRPITDTEIVRPKSKPYECPAGDWKCIAQELYKYGPMAVTFGPVCDDFYGHKHGVYEQPKDGKP